ncbi:aromatic ring-hydroxylating dioxygenase subunit alpha [Burkholderia ambifaria]|uniref:aromatic ring-hydroxylating dioxygenase subunit alpha n=1 Tax=Burkholderia ambifaria TaxID=152480 RepID=UPI00158D8138|nr:aromatic ring-hydroxylating dioxygenase subunit alpha [Burkholderia ambifaria]WDR97986.1 aromatic ring-hydroxylating dioxygenase subunit alpha [Burkholderia ambifaria]
MAFIRNAWYAAGWSTEIGSGKMFHRTVLGEQIVFYRKGDGSVAALLDRWPHRFVPLHLGTLRGDEIECGYHGLRFDCSGRCVKNPHGNGRIPDTLHIRGYPVQERHDLIWIWMGELPADPARIPDYGLIDAKSDYQVVTGGYLHISANYLLMGDNLLDLSHLMYLHDGLLGSSDQVDSDQSVREEDGKIICRRWAAKSSVPEIFDLLYRRDGKPVAMWTEIQWQAPSHFWFDGGVHAPESSGREHRGWWYGQHILTPETERTTHYFYAGALPLGTQLTEIEKARYSEMRRFAFVEQDKVMLDAQQAALGDADFWSMKPTLLSVDAAPVRMRRIVEQLLRAEQLESPPPDGT